MEIVTAIIICNVQCEQQNNTFPAADGCGTFREFRRGFTLRRVTEKIGRAAAYLAFFSALYLAQRALAAAAIFLRAARLMVRFFGAALAFGAVPLTLAQRALAAAEIFRRAAALIRRFLGAASSAGAESLTMA